MDIKELKKGLRDLRSDIEDFLDNLEMDGEDTQPKKEKKSLDAAKDESNHPGSKKDVSGKFSSKVEEDEDGRKKEH